MVVDIILIIALVLATFIEYKRGFAKVIVKLASFVLAIILAFALQSSVSEFIGQNIGLKNTIKTAVQSKLIEFTDKSSEDEKETKDVNIKILQKTMNEINNAAENQKSQIIDKWSDTIADFIIKGLSFIIIFAVVALVMGIVGLILDTIVKLPVLNTLNGTLGAIIGFVLMLFRIYIVLAILSFISPLQMTTGIMEYINGSCITKWLYENNIIISIMGRKLL